VTHRLLTVADHEVAAGGEAKTRIVVVASAVLPPSSTMWTLIVKLPRPA
jgi:hypothetical protein